MGWYGDYKCSEDVIDLISSDYEILDKKCMKSYGACLYEHKTTKEKGIDYFLFKDGMYKPLDWVEGFNRIPKTWIKEVEPFMSDYIKERYKEILKNKEAKKNKPKLDDILEIGKNYKIWGKHEVTYVTKRKRTHIFNLNGELTKFTGLKVDDVELIVD